MQMPADRRAVWASRLDLKSSHLQGRCPCLPGRHQDLKKKLSDLVSAYEVPRRRNQE